MGGTLSQNHLASSLLNFQPPGIMRDDKYLLLLKDIKFGIICCAAYITNTLFPHRHLIIIKLVTCLALWKIEMTWIGPVPDFHIWKCWKKIHQITWKKTKQNHITEEEGESFSNSHVLVCVRSLHRLSSSTCQPGEQQTC